MAVYIPSFVIDTEAQPDCLAEGHAEVVAKVVEGFRSFTGGHKFVTYANTYGRRDVFRVFNLYEQPAEADGCFSLHSIERSFGREAVSGIRFALGKHACAGARYVPEFSHACGERREPAPYLYDVKLTFSCKPFETADTVKRLVEALRKDRAAPNFLVFQGLTGSAATSHVVFPLEKCSGIAPGGSLFAYNPEKALGPQAAKKVWGAFVDSVVSCEATMLGYLPEASNPPVVH